MISLVTLSLTMCDNRDGAAYLQEVFDRESILHRLMSGTSPSDLQSKVRNIAIARHIPEERVLPYLEDLYKLSLPSKHSGCQSLCVKMRVMIKQFEDMTEVELDTHAAHGAEYAWWVLRGDVNRQKLLMEDLLPLLGNDLEDAEYAFGLFDLDGDGYVVEAEVHSRLQKMYRYDGTR